LRLFERILRNKQAKYLSHSCDISLFCPLVADSLHVTSIRAETRIVTFIVHSYLASQHQVCNFKYRTLDRLMQGMEENC